MSMTAMTTGTSTTLSPQIQQLVNDYCIPLFDFPNATDCFRSGLYPHFSGCVANSASYVQIFPPWYISWVAIPSFSATYRGFTAKQCMLANLTSPASQALVSEYCINQVVDVCVGFVNTVLSPFAGSAAAYTSNQYVRSISTGFYWPIAIYVLYASISILREVAHATPQFHLVYFFYASSIAQFLSYICWTFENYLVYLLLFAPFCFVSPTSALNTSFVYQALVGALSGQVAEFLQFPVAYIWCYQMLLLAAIATDRAAGIYFPFKYRQIDDKYAKKFLKFLTLGFTLICVLFVTCVLLGAFWAFVPTTTSIPASVAQPITIAAAAFFLFFLAIPLLLYASAAIAIIVGKFKMRRIGDLAPSDQTTEAQARAEARRAKENRELATLVLSTCLLNFFVAFCQVFQTFYDSVCGGIGAGSGFPSLKCAGQSFYNSILQPALIYIADLVFVTGFVVQCALSSIFRKGAIKFLNSTYIAKGIEVIRRRFYGGVIVAPAHTTGADGSAMGLNVLPGSNSVPVCVDS